MLGERSTVGSDESTEKKAHVESVPAERKIISDFLSGLLVAAAAVVVVHRHNQARRLLHGKTIGHAKVLPATVVHGQVLEVGEFVGHRRRGLGLMLQLLHGLLENVVPLAQLSGLEGVGSNQLVLLHVHAFDVLGDLLLSTDPFALLAEQFGLTDLHALQGVLEIVDDMGELLLFLFELFGVELLPLTRVKTGCG